MKEKGRTKLGQCGNSVETLLHLQVLAFLLFAGCFAGWEKVTRSALHVYQQTLAVQDAPIHTCMFRSGWSLVSFIDTCIDRQRGICLFSKNPVSSCPHTTNQHSVSCPAPQPQNKLYLSYTIGATLIVSVTKWSTTSGGRSSWLIPCDGLHYLW